ncbi:MAG: PqqD family peptide modification chaperone [Erysipelotrichaceae bacterium]|nr:PqqD family peptide modification chaperone [Erysipelotrichaceae bacterium]
MSEYQIRNGIVLEEILGRYLLISTEVARDKCVYIKAVEPLVAFYWEMMEQGLSISDMADQASKVFKGVERDVLIGDIKDLIAEMKEYGYLLKDDEIE